jgi:superfamily II DNA or RNA helicase
MRTKIDYSYQPIAAKKVLENALDSRYIASVLAACPSSGKTTISHIVINEYLKLFPAANVLVLTEAQKVLQHQFLSELDNPNVSINFTYGTIGSDKQVQVGIPQAIKQLKWDKIDLLVVDECHNWYLEKTDQGIIGKYKPTHQVIMTGSPTKFNRHNRENSTQYGMYYIPADKLQKMGVFSGVDVDVIKVNHKNNFKYIWETAKQRGANLSKVMVACSSILQADTVGYYLRQLGIKYTISTSTNDKYGTKIKDFKNGEYDVLIVVNRGILGFNDKMITTLIDIKSSKDIDASYQLFARVLRNHPDNIQKYYCRVSFNNKCSYNNEVLMLHKMVALMDEHNFKNFTGSNLKRV